MGDSVIRENTIQSRTVDGVEVDIVELTWKYSGGVCYDVYAHDSDGVVCISDESFSQVPGDSEISDLLSHRKFAVQYMITSEVDDEVVKADVIVVEAADEQRARGAATSWIENNDVMHDERIHPLITIVSVEVADGATEVTA